ncbi:MAG: transcriptional regulator [Candidatus Diapherotrites archaeon]|nr:transcriptional regulator [Candidatus Diapherotrites archaeon]
MVFDFLSLAKDSKLLNPNVFSVIRFQLLANLTAMGQHEDVPYRDLKAALNFGDGALYTNLKSLEKMGYVISKKIKSGNKELETYKITQSGLDEWKNVKEWLKKLVVDEYGF